MAEEKTQEQIALEKQYQNLIEQSSAALKQQVKLEADLQRYRGEKVSQAEQAVAQHREEVRLARELSELLDKNETTSLRMIEIYKKQLEEEQKVGKITVSNYETQMQILNEISGIQNEKIRLSSEENDENKAQIALLNKQLAALKDILNTQHRLKDAMIDGVKAGAGMVESLGSLVGLKTDLDQGIVGNLMRSVTETKSFESAIIGVESSFMELFGAGNILAFLTSNIVELTVVADKLTSSFVAATGAGREFNEVYIEAFRATSQLGVSLQDSAEATQGLFSDFTKFSAVSRATQVDLVATAAGFDKLGVSTRDFGDGLDFLVTGLGKNVKEAEAILKSFAVEGRAAGIAPQVLVQQFSALEPKLAAFGNQAPEIFMRTAKTAKALGMEVSELGQNLFNLSDGLSTFDQAAEKVASFNLVMGGSFVNAFDLTMAAAEGPFAQLEMLRQGFDNAGRSFENMNFFEQKMLADSFGISIGNLRAMMEGTMEPQEAMMSQEERFAGIVEDATTAIDKLSSAVQTLSGGLGFFSEGLSSVGGFIGKFTLIIGGALLGVRLLAGAFAQTAMGQSMQNVSKGMQVIAAATQQQAAANGTLAASESGLAVARGSSNQQLATTNALLAAQLRGNQLEKFEKATGIKQEQLFAQAKGVTNAQTDASIGKNVQEAQAKNVNTGATNTLTGATSRLGVAMSAVSGAMGVFGMLMALNLEGPARTIARFTAGIIALGIAIAAMRGVFADFSGAAKGLLAGAAFGAGLYAMMPEGSGITGTTGGGTGPTRSFTTPTEMTIPASPVDTQIPGFQSGGDNITTPFIMNEGPRPSGELMTPTSVLKSQDSINLTNTLKDTAKALTNTRKTDGQFDKMVQVLEKIAGNTEQAPNQRPQNINVTAEFDRRGFNKMVASAINSEMGV